MKRLLVGYKYNYYITDSGQVFKENTELSQSDNGLGYLFVHLKTIDGKRVNKYVHRLVWEAFNGPINNEINHIDHNKSNNNLSNLEDITREENLNKAVIFHGKETFTKNRTLKKTYTCPICGNPRSRNSKVCKECAPTYYMRPSSLYKYGVISKDELIKKMLVSNSFVELGQYFNMSDNGIRKWCKKYNLPYNKKDLKQWKRLRDDRKP